MLAVARSMSLTLVSLFVLDLFYGFYFPFSFLYFPPFLFFPVVLFCCCCCCFPFFTDLCNTHMPGGTSSLLVLSSLSRSLYRCRRYPRRCHRHCHVFVSVVITFTPSSSSSHARFSRHHFHTIAVIVAHFELELQNFKTQG